LHLDDLTSAETGTWTIDLTAAPGLAGQLVRATAFWQGAVRAVMTADPPNAKLGQPVNVTLSVLGPDGPITTPSELADLQVGVTVSGVGLTGPVRVPVSTGDSATSAGDYTGTFTAPHAAGTLTFTGTAAGYGLYATEVPATVQVGADLRGFTATVQPPIVNTVQTGQSIHGQVSFVNQAGPARTVRLELNVGHALAAIDPAGPITVRAGNPPSVPFTVTFSKRSPVGSAWLRVAVADAANPNVVYTNATINVNVTKPPGFLGKYLWAIVGVIALIILALLAAWWIRAARRRKIDVRGLIAMLRRNGEQMGAELRAPSKWSDAFRLIIRDEEQPTARLDYPQTGFSVYTVTRAGNGQVRLMTPVGERYDVVIGGPGEHLDHNGLELAFRDTRRQRVTRRPTSPQRRPGQQPVPQATDHNETISSSPAPAPRDEWLD
ncbi:MAG: hypothetical protein ACRDNF_23560, partial [Streptosporangiaceae bacterium]